MSATRRLAAGVYETLDGAYRIEYRAADGGYAAHWLLLAATPSGDWEYAQDFWTKSDAVESLNKG